MHVRVHVHIIWYSLAVIVAVPLVGGVMLTPGCVVAKVHSTRVVGDCIQLILFTCKYTHICVCEDDWVRMYLYIKSVTLYMCVCAPDAFFLSFPLLHCTIWLASCTCTHIQQYILPTGRVWLGDIFRDIESVGD